MIMVSKEEDGAEKPSRLIFLFLSLFLSFFLKWEGGSWDVVSAHFPLRASGNHGRLQPY